MRVERMVPGGEGLGRHPDGRVVFVRGALPGEAAEVELTQVKADCARGVAIEIHDPAATRVTPPCPHRREGCGGCDWQHVDPAAQLDLKVGVVAEALRRTGGLPDAEVRAGGAVPPWAHRTTVRVVGTPDGRAGFRREHSHDTVHAAGCLVAAPGLLGALDALRIPPGLEVTLRTSVATGAMTATWDHRLGDVTGLPPLALVGPDAALEEDVAGHRLRISAAAFAQSGPAAAELLVAAVMRAAPELPHASHVADLYGGVGLFAVTVAPPHARVTLVETSRAAVGDARVNLATRDARIHRGQVGGWTAQRGDDIDVVVADPARTGLGRPGVAAVARSEAPVLVLVSCDAVALARDAALLARQGYRHVSTEVLDLFPNTHHVEAVTRFVRDQPARTDPSSRARRARRR